MKPTFSLAILVVATLTTSLPMHAQPFYVFGHGAGQNKHPIQRTFDKCLGHWDGSRLSDWDLCIVNAEKSWDNELNRVYKDLLSVLPESRRNKFISSQQSWLKHYLMEQEFAFDAIQFEYSTGQEGLRMARQHYMEKKAFRVLELTDYLGILKDSSKERRP